MFLLLSAVLAYETYTTLGHPHLHPAIFAAFVLPLIRLKAAKNNKVLMLLYSLLSTASGAYVLYAGVGKTLTVINANGCNTYYGSVLALNLLGAGSFFAAMVYARLLVGLFDDGTTSKKGK